MAIFILVCLFLGPGPDFEVVRSLPVVSYAGPLAYDFCKLTANELTFAVRRDGLGADGETWVARCVEVKQKSED